MIKTYESFINESNQELNESLLLTLALGLSAIALRNKLASIISKKIKIMKAIKNEKDPEKKAFLKGRLEKLSNSQVDLIDTIRRNKEYEKRKISRLDKKLTKLSDADKAKAEILKKKLDAAKARVETAKYQLSKIGIKD